MTPVQIITIIDRIASVTGNKTSSICQKVLKNPDYYDRLQRRITDDVEKGRKFSDFLAELAADESEVDKADTDHQGAVI